MKSGIREVDMSGKKTPSIIIPDEYAKCDICGAPATSWARDIYQQPNYKTGFWEYQPSEMIHCGCDEHPAKSEIIEVLGSIYDILSEEQDNNDYTA
jgi:hypothetical protein